MKNLLILCLTTVIMWTSSLNADVFNESKTDIYFGNGVFNKQFSVCSKESSADCNAKELNQLIKREIINGDPKLEARYGEVMLQYNWSAGVNDLFEVGYQLTKADFSNFFEEIEQANVDEMWGKYYEESFKKSHRVLLVSHSQGNLFANRISDIIDPHNYNIYFANLQVASPAKMIKAFKGDYVTLDKDVIIAGNIDIGDIVKLFNIGAFFNMDIDMDIDISRIFLGSMQPNATLKANGSTDSLNHGFTTTYLSQKDSLDKIVEKLKTLLSSLDSEPSQWMMKNEIGKKGEKGYRHIVTHLFDDEVPELDNEVYPFDFLNNPSPSYLFKYLYQVPDRDGIPQYVKASFGGEKILDADYDDWDNKKDDQFYKLQGTDPAEYLTGCQDPSLFEIISHQNKYTFLWKVSVKNKKTNEIKNNVYPFNFEGSLYMLESGQWVLANCGGESIVNGWSGQKYNEFYLLEGTGEIIRENRFVRNDKTEIVTDGLTGNMWQDDIEAKTVKKLWMGQIGQHHDSMDGISMQADDTAMTYCENLSLGGYNDWRVPEDELNSIVNKNREPAIDEAFQNVNMDFYWTSMYGILKPNSILLHSFSWINGYNGVDFSFATQEEANNFFGMHIISFYNGSNDFYRRKPPYYCDGVIISDDRFESSTFRGGCYIRGKVSHFLSTRYNPLGDEIMKFNVRCMRKSS